MKNLKLIVAVIVIILVAVVAYSTGATEKLSDIKYMQDLIEGYGVLGYIVFILLLIAAAVFLLPASAFVIVAGMVFGPFLGAILSLLGFTLGAIVAFLIARYVARDTVISKFGDNPIFKKIENGVEKNGNDFLLITRLVPAFPYNIQNYIYGVTNMKLIPYSIITFIAMAPGAFLYAYMAGDIANNGVGFDTVIKLLGAGVILFGVAQIPKVIARKKGINLED